MRREEETYVQDRLGNVNRKLDTVRGLDGMYEDNGIIEVGEEDTGEELVLMELPDGSDGFHIEELHLYNSGAEGGTVQLFDAAMDDDGNIEELVARSVPITVPSETTRTVSYTGREFSADGIVVTSEVEGWVGAGGYMDMKEYIEPASEYHQEDE